MQQSLKTTFVTNNPTLLAQGSTVENIAVGQIGIIDAKTRTAVTSPTYATTKAFQLVWGTPDVPDLPLLSGVPNANIYSKLIKGKAIKAFRGKKAKRPQKQIITVGWSGDVSDTDTLFAKPGESRKLYLTLTGSPIDRLYSKQGITRVYDFTAKVDTVCTDTCTNVDPREIAESLVKQINADTRINRFVKASKTQTCSPDLDPVTTQTVYKFQLTVCDTKDDVALGLVQSQYPSSSVKRVGFTGASSIYEIQKTTNSTPTAFSNSGIVIIPNCETCPSGYSLVDNNFAYKLTKQDAGDAAALLSVATTYGIVAPETIARVAYEFGRSTYIITSATALTAAGAANEVQTLTISGTPTGGTFTITFAGQTTSAIAYNASAATVQTALVALSNINSGDVVVTGGALPGTLVTLTFGGQYANTNVPAITATSSLTGGTSPAITIATTTAGSSADALEFLGSAASSCVLDTPTTVSWTAAGSLTQYAKEYRITLGDTVCGDNRLTELQDFFVNNVVEIVDADGDCVHTYSTTVYSNPVEAGCSVDLISYTKPQAFDGVEWIAVSDEALPDGTTCLVGIKIEVAFVNRITGECTYDHFDYDADTIHVTASAFDPNYNDTSTRVEWVAKQIQSVQYPAGFGAYVRRLEQKSKSYELLERSFDPVVREIEKYSFQAQPFVYYDEYQIDFEYTSMVGGWGQQETDKYTLSLYFPESNGKNFEAAMNAYVSSVGIDQEPVVL